MAWSSSMRVRSSGVSTLTSGDFVEELLCPCGEGRWPVAEWACVVDDGGEFVVFDDVGPVLQDPVLPGRLMGSGVLEGVDLVGDVHVRICEEVVDDLALIGWGLREEFVEFEQPLACVGDADRCGCLGCGRASLGEPVAGGEGGVHELAPLVGEVGVIGERAVSGGVVGELVLVAPGGERADVVVVDDGCCRVGGAWPGPPGEPVRWGGAQLVEQLSLSLSDRRRDHLGFARVDALVGEGVVPGGEIAIDSFGEFGEEPFGEIRQLGGFGMVDRLELLPRQCLGVGVLAVAGGEGDGGVSGAVVEVVDGADVVPVERVDPAPDVHELSMVRRETEALERGVWIGKSLCPEAMDSGVDVTLAFGELAEVEVVGGVGDDVEVGACGERELFGVAVGERVDEVVFGVVDVLGGQWDAGGVSGFGDVGGVSGGGVEVGGVAGSGEGDVAGFAVEAGGADDVDVVAGESLGFVDGGRVAVIDAACLDVVAGEL